MVTGLAPGPCGRCLTDAPAQCETSSLYVYRGAVREAILGWKLNGDDAALGWLIQAASDRLQDKIEKDDLLLPVPMPLSRMRRQGRHHAAELCRLMAAQVGCAWDWRVLRRVGQQARQSSLSAKERRRNLRWAFSLNMAQWTGLEKRLGNIWLIDDIITTGSTVHFAAKALRKTGLDVHVLSLARTIKRV